MSVKLGGVICDKCRVIIGPDRSKVKYWKKTKKGMRMDYCGAECSWEHSGKGNGEKDKQGAG